MGSGLTKVSRTKKTKPKPYEYIQIFKMIDDIVPYNARKTALLYTTLDKKRHSMPYNELNTLSNNFARALSYLIAIDPLEENVFMVYSEANLIVIAILLGIWKAGAAYLAIDSVHHNISISKVIDECKPICILYDEEFSDSFNDVDYSNKITIANFLLLANRADIQNMKNLPTPLHDSFDSLACICYSSGCDSSPNAVRISHRNLWYRLQGEWNLFPYSRREKYGLFQTSLICAESLTELWSPLVHGNTVLVMPLQFRFQIDKLTAILQEFPLYRLNTVPDVVASIIQNYSSWNVNLRHVKNLSNIKNWLCGGFLLSTTLINDFYRTFGNDSCKIYNVYSCSELCGAASYNLCTPHSASLHDFASIASEPLEKSTKFYVVNENMELVADGQKGELCVSGPIVAKGYKSPSVNQIRSNPFSVEENYEKVFLSGDYCIKDGSNYFLLGRKKQEIKIHNKIINIVSLEKYLESSDLVSKAAVIVLNGNSMVVFVQLMPPSPLNVKSEIEDMVFEFINLDAEVVLLEKFPYSLNAKVDRTMLSNCYKDVGPINAYVRASQPDLLKQNETFLKTDLFQGIMTVLDNQVPMLTLDMDFFDMHITPMQALNFFLYLTQKGYHMSFDDFLSCHSFQAIRQKMYESLKEEKQISNSKNSLDDKPFESVLFRDGNQSDIIRFIRKVLQAKTIELTRYTNPEKFLTDFCIFLNTIWEDLEDFSFVVEDSKTSSMVGFSLNCHGSNFPKDDAPSGVHIVLDFYEHVLASLRDQYFAPINSLILLNFHSECVESFGTRESLQFIQFVEEEKVKVAESSSLFNILCIHIDPLMQKISNELYYYKTMVNYTINNYMVKSMKPFLDAPDTMVALVQWRVLRH